MAVQLHYHPMDAHDYLREIPDQKDGSDLIYAPRQPASQLTLPKTNITPSKDGIWKG